ncbi:MULTISPECIES: hypothetical protein, partial [Bartonella]|uniref:hypothetical protein n=1 Tax=Bartonella TaxID=773 RepID=UPI001AED7CD5
KVSKSQSLKVSKSQSLKVSKSQSLKVSKSQSLKASKPQSSVILSSETLTASFQQNRCNEEMLRRRLENTLLVW